MDVRGYTSIYAGYAPLEQSEWRFDFGARDGDRMPVIGASSQVASCGVTDPSALLSSLQGRYHAEISLLERGGRIPRLDTAIRIIDCTDGDPRDLFEGIARHEPPDRRGKGWFTVAGVQGPADLRPSRRGSEDR